MPRLRSLCLAAAVAAALVPAVLAGCTANSEDVRPDPKEILYPTGIAIAPDESVLFSANANSDLRYDTGSISVTDLALVQRAADAWRTSKVVPTGCHQDSSLTYQLVCDEAQFLELDAGVRIGNFATAIGVQDLGGGRLRLITAVRGDPSITWLEWDGARLSCDDSTQGFSICDDEHRRSLIREDASIGSMPDEPFDVYVDSGMQYAAVSHLTAGAVTLVDSRQDKPAVIADVIAGLFAVDSLTGIRAATGLAGRTPGTPDNLIYTVSRSEDRVEMLAVERPTPDALPFLVPAGFFFLDGVGSTNGGSVDSRGLEFSPGGNRMYLINRRPPSLQVWDTSLGQDGAPRNEISGSVDICREAADLTVADTGDGERVYVSCFRDGEIYVINPEGTPRVESVIAVGRGPNSVVASATRQELYVTNYLEDTIAVIDLAEGSPTRFRVVLRLGEPRE